MKIKSLIFLFIILIIVTVNFVIISITKNTEKKALNDSSYKTIKDVYFSFKVPSNFDKHKVKNNKGWNTETYYLRKYATFNFSRISFENPNFDRLCKKYFLLKEFQKVNDISKTSNGLIFYKKINILENGIYVIRKRGKRINYVYFFTINNNLYWFDFYPKSSFVVYKKIFDNILKSIEFNNNSKPGEDFSRQLNDVCLDSYFLFCQPYEIVFIFPIVLILFIWLIISIVTVRMGKKPDFETLSYLNALYYEENVEFASIYRGKKQYTSCFFAINSTELVIFKFKKIFIKLPINENKGNFLEKTGFFGRKYIEIQINNNEPYVKKRIFQNRKHKIRIYPNNTSSVMAYLC